MRGLVVIPAYQEFDSLPALFDRIGAAGVREEILVVDDGSTDGSAAWLLARGIPHVRHPFNLGYTAALETGMLRARAMGCDYVVFLDADGQHDPADLGKLAREIENGADVAIGSRYLDGYAGQSWSRRLGSVLFSAATSLSGVRVRDTTSGYKALSRRAIAAALEGAFGDYHAEFLLDMAGRGLRVREIPIQVRERKKGRSMYGLLSHFHYPAKTLLLILTRFLPGVRR
ncbi:MAG: glycosyltransferase family 2 protein [Planctomycetes bacterium]|nr:glycosyltransferase family 2 protein [Planctomycetota bacterium]